ncbi:uncharacterized protein ACRADG_010750 [Cochliomyia hominivorax]
MSDNDGSNKDMPIRKRASLVWQYFEKLSSVRVKCRICQHEQRYMGNTANALRHLKAKHDIDARAIGLSDPENVKRMKALSTVGIPFEPTIAAIHIKNECNFDDEEEDQHQTNEKEVDEVEDDHHFKYSSNDQRISIYDNADNDIDPYGNNDEPLVDFNDTKNHYMSKYDEDDEDTFNQNRKLKSASTRKRSSLEDERTRAEIEYFREKAAYFRILKHLTALQAKKVKFELEQLYEKQ